MTRLLAVHDGSNNLVMRFTYADGRMPVAMTKSGVTYYLAYDQIGSLRVVMDSTGAVVKELLYDSFGSIIYESNAAFTVPFRFAGGLYDRDTGLVQFGFRDYDSNIARWTAKDPIDFAGGDLNLFGYVGNNPVNWIDPYGLAPGDKFPTKDQAAIDAMDYIMNTSARADREYGGYLYQNKDNSFSYTAPVRGERREMDVSKFPCRPEGTDKAGIYHTHPGTDYNSTQFSADDSLAAISYGDIYLGTKAGLVKVWNSWKGERIVREPSRR
jgi:RHS repeat-associated protein